MKVKFISKEQLLEMLENQEPFKLVEVLAEEDYKKGHLPKAINIPVDKLEELASGFLSDKNETIVVYCSGFMCTASTGAARKLQSMGYKKVLDYKGGKPDWTQAGLPLIQ
ncbi:MAG: rhodanese-like domain-containing protein [Parcubacteria group bacterium]|nr:rhodanese-like domain-containing protein [Parcubacteria group bacterium]